MLTALLVITQLSSAAANDADASYPNRVREYRDVICETVTSRPLEELILHLDAPWIPGSDHVIEIIAGETLCIIGKFEDQRAVRLRVVESASADQAPLKLRFVSDYLSSDERLLTRLEVNSLGDSAWYYHFTARAEGTRSFTPAVGAAVRPAGFREHWFRDSRKLRVFNLFRQDRPYEAAVQDSPTSPAPLTLYTPRKPPSPSTEFEPTHFSFTFSAAGFYTVDNLGDLNAELWASGYSGFTAPRWLIGGELGGTWQRFRWSVDAATSLGGSYERSSDGTEFSVSQFMLGFHAGWDVVRWGTLSVYPMLGLGGSDINVSFDPADPALGLDPAAANESDAETAEALSSSFAGTLSLGVEYLLPWGEGSSRVKSGLVFGARAGYSQQLARGGWRTTDKDPRDLNGGPDIDLSGPFLRITVGLGVFKFE